MVQCCGRIVAVLTAAALLVAPGIGFAAQKAEMLQVAAGPLSGKLATSNGTAMSDVQLRLVQNGKVVAETRTDKAGEYKFAGLAQGQYQMMVGQEKAFDFSAVQDSKITTLSFVVPQRDYAAADLATLSQTQWVWIIVGTAVVVAVSVPVLYNTTDVFGGGTHHSP